MREISQVAALFCALHLVVGGPLKPLPEDNGNDPWLEPEPSIEPGLTNEMQLQWLASPPTSGYYRWHDDLMRRSPKASTRYTAGELVDLLRRLAASRRLRQVRVANKGLRFGISKRSLRQQF